MHSESTKIIVTLLGLNMGQKLRGLGIKHVRVRINGFNAARLSTVKGITQVLISGSWSEKVKVKFYRGHVFLK